MKTNSFTYAKIFFLINALLFLLKAQAQVWNLAQGAALRGRGHTGINISDEWSLSQNIAGIAGVKRHSVTTSFQELYGVMALNAASAGVILPFNKIVSGIQFKKLGDHVLNEQLLAFAVAHEVGIVKLGFKTNLLQINQLGLGSNTLPIFEFGVITKLGKKTFLGTHVFNLTQAVIANEYDERVPTIATLGFTYKPTKDLIINLETQKELENSLLIKAGLEYKPLEFLKIRTGAIIPSKMAFFGAGLILKNLSIDYSLGNHAHLGSSNELSLSYSFDFRKSAIRRK